MKRMESYKVNTPEGTGDKLFGECDRQRSAEAAITKLFRRRGYREVITPSVEYYDLFVQARNPIPQESMLKLVDRSGRILVLRPDCTTPIARVAATRLDPARLPQRLFYDQVIFRSLDPNHGSSSEIPQCGIELIGASGPRADAEAVALAIEAVRAAGVEEFRIELGHTGFFTALAEELGAGEKRVEELRACIENKSFAVLEDLLRDSASPAAAALRRLAVLFGGAEILADAGKLTENAAALAALDYLEGIYRELAAAGLEKYLSFDLGLVSGLDYYTGLIFRGYAPGTGGVIAAGGRYDRLLSDFGKALPATGFAVYVDALVACLDGAETVRTDTLVFYERGSLGDALALLAGMEAGRAELSTHESLEDSLREARAKGYSRLIRVRPGAAEEVLL